MPLNAPRLAANIEADLIALYRTRPTEDQTRDIDYFLRQYSLILATRVIQEFQTNATLVGTDSHGDTHGGILIV
jgi:hypothetical protein